MWRGLVVARRGDEACVHAASAGGAGRAAVEGDLEVVGVLFLEGAAHADLDGHGAEVGGDAVNAAIYGAGNGLEAADDAGEVVLVLGREFLDRGHDL